jgi:LysM repeat protein
VRFAAPALLFFCCATFGALISRAQDQQDQNVADAARQEKARKQEQQKHAKHVYTEEDLKHPQILTPEDRAQIEAKRNECAQKNNCLPAAPLNPPASLDANSQTPQIPLGDVARQYRKRKELQALQPKQTEPFHLPFSTPALASPILPERPATRVPAQPALHSKMPTNIFRRDPFSAVPVRPNVPARPRADVRPVAPENVRPVVRPKVHAAVRENFPRAIRPDAHADVHANVREDARPTVRPDARADFHKDVPPTVRPHTRPIVPAQPKISSDPASPSFLVQPAQPTVVAKPAQPVAPIEMVRPVQPQRTVPSSALAPQKTLSVRRGDSLWKLAQQNLGRGNRWPEFLASNRWIANPNQIRIGAQLSLPPVAATPVARHTPNRNASSTIKVRKGDSLWNLAKSNLGRSSHWPCLAAANPSIADPGRIYEGQYLLLPASCGSQARPDGTPLLRLPHGLLR